MPVNRYTFNWREFRTTYVLQCQDKIWDTNWTNVSIWVYHYPVKLKVNLGAHLDMKWLRPWIWSISANFVLGFKQARYFMMKLILYYLVTMKSYFDERYKRDMFSSVCCQLTILSNKAWNLGAYQQRHPVLTSRVLVPNVFSGAGQEPNWS